jgi:hypothetical protein
MNLKQINKQIQEKQNLLEDKKALLEKSEQIEEETKFDNDYHEMIKEIADCFFLFYDKYNIIPDETIIDSQTKNNLKKIYLKLHPDKAGQDYNYENFEEFNSCYKKVYDNFFTYNMPEKPDFLQLANFYYKIHKLLIPTTEIYFYMFTKIYDDYIDQKIDYSQLKKKIDYSNIEILEYYYNMFNDFIKKNGNLPKVNLGKQKNKDDDDNDNDSLIIRIINNIMKNISEQSSYGSLLKIKQKYESICLMKYDKYTKKDLEIGSPLYNKLLEKFDNTFTDTDIYLRKFLSSKYYYNDEEPDKLVKSWIEYFQKKGLSYNEEQMFEDIKLHRNNRKNMDHNVGQLFIYTCGFVYGYNLAINFLKNNGLKIYLYQLDYLIHRQKLIKEINKLESEIDELKREYKKEPEKKADIYPSDFETCNKKGKPYDKQKLKEIAKELGLKISQNKPELCSAIIEKLYNIKTNLSEGKEINECPKNLEHDDCIDRKQYKLPDVKVIAKKCGIKISRKNKGQLCDEIIKYIDTQATSKKSKSKKSSDKNDKCYGDMTKIRCNIRGKPYDISKVKEIAKNCGIKIGNKTKKKLCNEIFGK